MTIIPTSGLVVSTQEANRPFNFGAETQVLEYSAYLFYCSENGLLTTSGEQSRRALIRKTFIHKGGTGDSWREAMLSWLQSETGNLSTNLQTQWALYFLLYATDPDSEGVTYAGLSLEAAYRKFLYEHLGLAENFYDNLLVSDKAFRSVVRSISDSLSISDSAAAQFLSTELGIHADSLTPADSIVVTVGKGISDTLSLSEGMELVVTKNIFDSLNLSDSVSHTGQIPAGAISDTTSPTDRIVLSVVRNITGDSVTPSSSALSKVTRYIEDTVSLSDAIAFTLEFDGNIPPDHVVSEDTILIAVTKNLSETITITDDAAVGEPGFGAGLFGDFYFGA